MKQPWISVLIPIHNGKDYLSWALDSILAQEDSDIECVLINDGSTDSSIEIARSYSERLPLKIIDKVSYGNWVATTNHVLSIAQAEYVCFLHQDDYWLSNRLAVMKPLVKEFSDVALFLSSTQFVDSKNRALGLWRCPLPGSPELIQPKFMISRLLIQNFIAIPAPIFRRDIAIQVGGLDETLWYTADWDFWLKIATHGLTLYHPEPLAAFRIHSESQTMRRSNYLEDFQQQINIVLDRHLHSSIVSFQIPYQTKLIADFSIQVNRALAATVHKQQGNWRQLMYTLVKLGPLQGYSYIRDSRIIERVWARLKAKLINMRFK